MPPAHDSAQRLVIPADRRGAGARLAAALVLAGAGGVLALWGWLSGATAPLAGGLALVVFFLAASLLSARRLRRRDPLLVADRDGVELAGREGALRVGWDDVLAVRCRTRTFRRGVLLSLRVDPSGDETREVRIGAEQLGGAPPEWLAGLLETFRSRPDLRARLGSRLDAGPS
jgi:hypothetical protein